MYIVSEVYREHSVLVLHTVYIQYFIVPSVSVELASITEVQQFGMLCYIFLKTTNNQQNIIPASEPKKLALNTKSWKNSGVLELHFNSFLFYICWWVKLD